MSNRRNSYNEKLIQLFDKQKYDSIEKANLCMEIGIRMRGGIPVVCDEKPLHFFMMAARIYKKLHLNGKARGAFIYASRECIKYNRPKWLKSIKEEHKLGKI